MANERGRTINRIQTKSDLISFLNLKKMKMIKKESKDAEGITSDEEKALEDDLRSNADRG